MQNTSKSSPTSFLQEASNDMHENDGAALNVNILVKIRSTPYQVSQRGTVWLLLGRRRGCGGRDVWCRSGDWCAAVSTASSDRSTAFDYQDPCFGGQIAFCLGSKRVPKHAFRGLTTCDDMRTSFWRYEIMGATKCAECGRSQFVSLERKHKPRSCLALSGQAGQADNKRDHEEHHRTLSC